MREMPLDIGTLHFVGIGGIGMSGIAEVLHTLGYSVQGADQNDSANVARLRAMGIPVTIGHAADNVANAGVVVVSTAVTADNPEVTAAREAFKPVVRRSEMLAELMRLKWTVSVAGTHGKTTTTSLVAALLDAADLDPTVINGGIINAYGTNARLGSGDWMVVEADESDGTFLRLPSVIAVVTNIDPEHVEHYGSFDALREAFRTFVESIPFYGFAVMCIDHPEVQALLPDLRDRRVISYGLSPQAGLRAVNVQMTADGTRFDVHHTDRASGTQTAIGDLHLPMFGEHNVQNALAGIAVALEMGLPGEVIRDGLAGFGGVKRRFTRTGQYDGVTVIDDYGHHPVEIASVLKAARAVTDNRVIAVMQPHRYSRLEALFEDFCTCFNDADTVVVTHVYAAGEDPIEGVDRDALVAGLREHGHRSVVPLDSREALPGLIRRLARPGDLVMCLGAGSISQWANALPGELQALAEGHDDDRRDARREEGA